MKILFLDAYFEPEQTAFSHLENDLLEGLIHAEHEIEVICPIPTRGVNDIVVHEYKNKKREILFDGHVHVTRFSAPREKKNPIFRALRYFWCNFRTYQISKRIKNVDAVFSNSTPPTQGFIAGKIADKHKVPFIYSLQDIFPDSLINIGLTHKGSFLWNIGRFIENSSYRYADKIIVINEDCKRNIIEKGVPSDKITVISNWIDFDMISPVLRDNNTIFDEFSIDRSDFIVLYAGNLGEAQGGDVIINAAKELVSYPDIQFVIFGGGARYQEIKSRIEKEKVNNIFITGLQPQERVSEVYSMGNIALITCKPGTGNAGMPSKTWSILACNTPIIACFDINSDLDDVIRESGAGKCVEPGNPQALADAVLQAYRDWKRGEKTNVNLREYALRKASKEICVRKYIDTLVSVVKEVEK